MPRNLPIFVFAALLMACGSRTADNADAGAGADLPHKKDGFLRADTGPVRHDGAIPRDGKVLADSKVLPDAPFSPNGKCASAIPLGFSGGKAKALGDTGKFANEYGTAVNCGSSSTVMRGRQQYYKIPLVAGTSYLFALKAAYSNAYFYIFTQCSVSKINADCSSKGKTGAISSAVSAGQVASLIFKPVISGTYHLAVDATRASRYGKFELTVEEYKPAQNSTCATAKLLTLPAGGKVTESATTAGAKDEFPTITCGSNYTMDGPQMYYKVMLSANKTYRVSWTPQFTYSRVYLFGGSCSAAAIQQACSSKGKTGAYSGPTAAGQENSFTFKPSTNGYYTIAVDSRVSSYSGKFTLTVEDWSQPVNSTCAKPAPLKLVGGKVTVKGSTYGAKNEFGTSIRCGTTSTFDGAQVYYSLALTGGTTYKLTLTPSFSARLYLFNSACNALGINASCGSKGTTGAVSNTINAGVTSSLVVKPLASGTYKIAVDSPYATSSGSFSLTVETYAQPTNGKCAKPKPLTLVGGKVSVTGDTTGMANEFGTAISCGYYTGAFDGPQVYYSINLIKGKSYIVRLKPGFLSRYYIFGSSCSASLINSACSSNGATGAYATVNAGSTGTMLFTAPASGSYHIVVDSQNPVYFGSFTLSVDLFTPPSNAACAGAKAVTLGSGTTTISGDTRYVTNEFGTAINCGSYSTSSILMGSQLYYKVQLTAGKSYSFSFTPYYSYARMYLFGGACTYTAINADCGSKGVTGLVSSSASSGSTVNTSFTPKKTTTYTIAVDSTQTSTTASGAFTLQIK